MKYTTVIIGRSKVWDLGKFELPGEKDKIVNALMYPCEQVPALREAIKAKKPIPPISGT